jgi:hypothetical protein
MEAASTFLLTNQPYQSGPLNHELLGRAPYLIFIS